VLLNCVPGAECYVNRGVAEYFCDESSFRTSVGEEGPFFGGFGFWFGRAEVEMCGSVVSVM
jgi:hypothetical protein